jgi:hypothetical protein
MTTLARSTALCLVLAALAGCSGQTKEARALHKVIVFDRTGCAFMLRANLGDTMFADRLSDLDRQGCDAKRFQEVTP